MALDLRTWMRVHGVKAESAMVFNSCTERVAARVSEAQLRNWDGQAQVKVLARDGHTYEKPRDLDYVFRGSRL